MSSSLTLRAIVNGRAQPIHAATIKQALDTLDARGTPASAIYLTNPTPRVSCRYGAPMGRGDIGTIDANGRLSAVRVPIDSQGYDQGGAYWGQRARGKHLYAIQDGQGNLAFLDAPSSPAAKKMA